MNSSPQLKSPPPRDRHPTIDPKLELLAQWMDNAFHIPILGTRFGMDALIGLVPGVGDTVSSVVSLYILNAARRYGVPRVTMMRMATNVAVDYLLGSVPLVGDLFDVYWKANLKNVALLRQHLLTTPAAERRSRVGDWIFMAVIFSVLIAILIGSLIIACWLVMAVTHLLARR